MGTQPQRCFAPGCHKLRGVMSVAGIETSEEVGDWKGGAMLLCEAWAQNWAQPVATRMLSWRREESSPYPREHPNATPGK